MKVSAFLRGNNVLAESILLVEIPYKSKKNEAASSRIFIR